MSIKFWKQFILILTVSFLIITGCVALWVTTLRIPDLSSFQDKALEQSTKIYDRTGQIVLYNVNQNVRRQVVPFDQISQNVKNATIAIEDENFYTHKGIEITSIIRAIVADLKTLEFSQGGSTITQQVIKNSLLTTDKKISRKIKEWVLALKLERQMSKDGILNLYLNSTSYGGSYYGVEEASLHFLGKSSKDLTIAEAAYIAALPQAPSLYSPYGNHKNLLDDRKNRVLLKMKELNYITEAQYNAARAEVVTFKPLDDHSIKAPHFVMYVKEYLVQKYGEDVVNNGELKVITSLDYDLQKQAEEITLKYALENKKNFNAENAGVVAIEPSTGQILTMVGSRDYFDTKIDGNFNVTLAHRQPGSAFKPFAYATAFNKGYTPDTVLFDVPTQFSTTCDAQGKPLNPTAATTTCYSPQNYDLKFRGPMSLRNALDQSINIPAIKVLYLAGIKDTLQTAKDMGITSLGDSNQYGLTLVLGGGEVSPLEMTSAYSVFANNGMRNPYTPILKVTDKNGKVLEEFTPNPTQAIPEQTALLINDVLHDNNARLPLNGAGAPTDFPDKEIALKTGTTNDYKDVWIVGYTPKIAVGAWAGNNNNSPMVKKTSGTIIAPLWRAFMNKVLEKYPAETFKRPDPIDPNLKPILRGVWQGDQGSGVHSILYWVDKDNPKGPPPANPQQDPQFTLWETPIQAWVVNNGGNVPSPIENVSTPPQTTIISNDPNPHVTITNPIPNGVYSLNIPIIVSIQHTNKFPITKAELYINGKLISVSVKDPYSFTFIPREIPRIRESNTLKVVVYDSNNSKTESSVIFRAI